MIKSVNILGINFTSGAHEEILEKCIKDGGYIIAPSAPTLVYAKENQYFYECFLAADNAILDSGFLVLIWNIIYKEKINKFSGLRYLRALLKKLTPTDFDNTLWILPDELSAEKTKSMLFNQCNKFNFYIAPKYPKDGVIHDLELMNIINKTSPKHVIVAIGGGTQERLARNIKDSYQKKTCIHCIGGALAFLNKTQVCIPEWADALSLGWLFRCIYLPSLYVPRYWHSLNLLKIALNGLKKPITH
ncbi:MAG: WecB/TagA/CpsF family glycosyltransferase [Chryseobacterium sp.]